MEIIISTDDQEFAGQFMVPRSYVQTMDEESMDHFTYSKMSDIEHRIIGKKVYPWIEHLEVSSELENASRDTVQIDTVIHGIINELATFYISTIG